MPRLCFLLVLGGILACLTSGLAPGTARADGTQLCRSFTAITLAPTDLVFTPYVAYRDIRNRMADYDDSRGVKIAYMVPGYVFLNMVQVYGTAMRIVAGALEFVPGLFTFFREGSPTPFFQNWAENGAEAVFYREYGPCPVMIGSSYTAGGY
jgi:hypothetical protein